MTEKMLLETIENKYKDEWILVVNPEVSVNNEVIKGEVAYHSKDRGAIHRKLSKCKGNKALIYTGKIPDDVGVLL